MMIHSMRTMLAALILCMALFGCDNQNSSTSQKQAYQALKMFPQGKSFSGFTLTSHENKTWDANAFKGAYSVVFFGFTNCPDICPTTLLDMQKIDKQLKSQNIASPQFIFVSVDPDRDTPEVMKEYIGFFNPEFIGLTGDAPNILSIASQLGVAYKVAEHDKGDMVYDVDHASALFVLNPEGERIGIFPAPHKVDTIVNDLELLMEKS